MPYSSRRRQVSAAGRRRRTGAARSAPQDRRRQVGAANACRPSQHYERRHNQGRDVCAWLRRRVVELIRDDRRGDGSPGDSKHFNRERLTGHSASASGTGSADLPQ
jgi:hypothetical protein